MEPDNINIPKTPKIAIIYDPDHKDPDQIAITDKLSRIDPEKNIVFFRENRFLESPLLNQYSIELYNEKLSTASSCCLLLSMMLTKTEPKAIKVIFGTIYCDPYLRQLFDEQQYKNYSPANYGVDTPWAMLDQLNMSESQVNVLKKMGEVFSFLDKELPNQPTGTGEKFFDDCITQLAQEIIKNDKKFDIKTIVAVAEALAFLKIEFVQKNLNPEITTTHELSTSVIKELYSENRVSLLIDLNIKFRTSFQVQKIIMIVEKILKTEKQSPNTIFVVRVGQLHQEIMTDSLVKYFKTGDIKELELLAGDLPKVEKKLKKQFKVSKESSDSLIENSKKKLQKWFKK